MDGHVLLSTDETMEGQSITIPEGVMSAVLEQGTWAGRSRLDQLYESKRFVGGVSVVSPTTGKVLGSVFTVSSGDTVDTLWRTFAGLLVMTALRGADDLLYGVLHHHHAADPAHPGDGTGHPPLCGGGL